MKEFKVTKDKAIDEEIVGLILFCALFVVWLALCLPDACDWFARF